MIDLYRKSFFAATFFFLFFIVDLLLFFFSPLLVFLLFFAAHVFLYFYYLRCRVAFVRAFETAASAKTELRKQPSSDKIRINKHREEVADADI